MSESAMLNPAVQEQGTQTAKPERAQQLWVLGAATIGIALGYSNIAWQGFGLFVPTLSKAHGWTISEISFAFTILALVVVVVSPIAGIALDKFGVRRVVLPSIIMFAIAIASLGLVGDRLWQFYLTYAAVAVFGSGTLPASYARAVVGWFDARRGLALGIMLAGISLGGILYPPFVQSMLETTDLRTTYFTVAAVIVVIAFPVVALCLRERAEHMPSGHHEKIPFGELCHNAHFLKLAGGFFALGVYNSGVATHLVSIMISREVSPYAAALSMSLLAAGIGVGRIGAGWMIDRFFAPYVIFGFTIAPIIGLVLLALGVSGNWALVCAVLLGIGLGAEIDFMSYLVSRYFRTRHYGQVSSTIYSTHLAGAAFGPPLVAYSIESLGSYNPGLTVLAVLVAASIPAFVTLGPFPKFEK